jgi:hypothetical protein
MQYDDTSFYPSDFGTSDAGSYDLGPTALDTSGLYGGLDSGLTGFNSQLQSPLSTPTPPAQQQGLIPGLGAAGGANSLQGLLGLLGGGAGLIGTLASGGVTGTQRPTLPTAQKAMIGQANQALQPGALGQLPLQQQQSSLLQSLLQGQVPPAYAKLVANAYDPAYQNAATRSIQGAQQAGFYDNPLSSPVGGNIMGPAAAQLQGQQANTLLGLLTQIPGLFQAPINAQLGAAGSQANALLSGGQQYAGQQNSVPLAGQLGTQLGSGLQGVSQGLGQANQQQFNNQLLQQLVAQQGGGGIGPGGAQGVAPQATGAQNLFQNQGAQMPNTQLGLNTPLGSQQGTTGSYY